MATKSFNKVDSFVEAMAEQVHNLGSDQLVVALTNAANPPVAGNSQLSNLTEISYANLSTRNITTISSLQTSGTYKLILTDLVLTAGSGGLSAFQYVVLYNDTAGNDELIGYYDYESEITLAENDTTTVKFDGSLGVLTVA